ncbi:MAG: ATPase, T2SS/T4P/T4SS family [Nitrospirota bacterium]|nr:ATPase, T2SS/T4P/T4SS family [Nitrospirota bacterium]
MAVGETKKQMLGEMLIAGGLLKEDQLAKALEEQKRRGGRIGEILIDLGFLTERNLAAFLSKQLHIPYVEIERQLIDPDVTKLVPAAMAQRLSALPLYRDKDTLIVAMADPLNIYGVDDLTKETKLDIELRVAERTDILRAVSKYYGMAPAIEEAEREFGASAAAEAAPVTAATDESPVVKLVSMLLAQAIMDRASDIHVDPEGRHIQVRFRIDGVLQQVKTLPREMLAPIVSRIKILAQMDIAERRVPQDGRFQALIVQTEAGPMVTSFFSERNALRLAGDTRVDVRVSTLPVLQGENVVMRILERSAIITDLGGLRFTPEMLDCYRKLIRRPYGMILVTGPTGSGKTTTLYASLVALDRKAMNIVTVEDPVEYQLMGMNQVQVNPKAGVTFADGLRSILRQDPDVIMVGEIRDRETAEIAIHAALTGHLVFSTLHTNDAAGAATRLVDMGIEPFLIASSTIGIIAQRLVRKICDNCKTSYPATPEMLAELGMTASPPLFYRGKGCVACKGTGYRGRLGIFELILLNEAVRSRIMAKAPVAEIRATAFQGGCRPLRQEGLLKAAEGLTTVEEVLRVTQEADM